MFFKTKSRRNVSIVSIDEATFATLDGLTSDGDAVLTFRYNVDIKQAAEKKARTCRLQIRKFRQKNVQIFEQQAVGTNVNQQLVDNVKSMVVDLKNASKQNDGAVVSVLNQSIRTKLPLVTKSKLVVRSVKDITGDNDEDPILHFVAHKNVTETITSISSSIRFEAQNLMHEMLLKQGIDPSSISTLTPRDMTSKNSFEGTLRSSSRNDDEIDLTNQLLSIHLQPQPNLTSTNDVEQINHVNVVRTVTIDKQPMVARMVIGKKDLENSQYQFIVEISVIDPATGGSLQTIDHQIDVNQLLEFFLQPRVKPHVIVSDLDLGSRAKFEIIKGDDRTVGFSIYRKVLNMTSTINDAYVLVRNVSLKAGHNSVDFIVNRQSSSTVIYRFIPRGEKGFLANEFENVVIAPFRPVQDRSLSLVARQHELGVEIEAQSFPPGLVALEFLVRDLSIFETSYRNVAGTTFFITDALKAGNLLSTIDDQVFDRHVYEYVARLHYNSGISELSLPSIIESVKTRAERITIDVTNMNVTYSDNVPNVTFDIVSHFDDETINVIEKLLTDQNMRDLFQNELGIEKDTINKLIVHNVDRVDLTTGQRVNMGFISNSTFNDAELRRNANSPLVIGHKYQYEISARIRSIDSILQSFTKTVKDSTTNKTYSFAPSKFKNPITLIDGVLVSKQGLSLLSKNSFDLGDVGAITFVDVNFDEPKFQVVDLQASRFNAGFNLVSWKIVTNVIDVIDHYLIMKDVNGVRSIVGKSHPNFAFGNVSFYHRLTEHDQGEFRYVIVPIKNDYDLMSEFISNAVVV